MDRQPSRSSRNCSATIPQDGPSQVFIERCHEPPGAAPGGQLGRGLRDEDQVRKRIPRFSLIPQSASPRRRVLFRNNGKACWKASFFSSSSLLHWAQFPLEGGKGMTKIYPLLRKVCWGLGVISLILGLVLKIVTLLTVVDWRYSTRGALVLAAVLFLVCAGHA